MSQTNQKRLHLEIDPAIVVVLDAMKWQFKTTRTELVERAIVEFVSKYKTSQELPEQKKLL